MLGGSFRLASLVATHLAISAIASSAFADAGAPAPGGGGAGGTAGIPQPPTHGGAPTSSTEDAPDEEPPAEEAPVDEDDGTVPAEDPTGEEPANGATHERAPIAEPLTATPRSSEAVDDTTPLRRDFLRRLRKTAENIERVRTSERTHARTEGDLTVLSNVAPLEARDTTDDGIHEERVHDDDDAEPGSGVGQHGEPPRDVPRATQDRTVQSESADLAPEEDGWSWLWILGGIATVLLVPIGMLLSRATRRA